MLEEMFRVPHNAPSTPQRSLTGEVRERTIWGYWAQGYESMPEFFKLCVGTWQRHNPHWDVRILDKATVHEYLSAAELPNRFMHMLSHQAASDAVRLGVLSRYGGVYMDVNILLRASLDDMCWNAISSNERAAAVFYHPHYGTEAFDGKDLTESWFLATLPGNPFFLQWRDLFKELLHNRLDIDGLLEHPLYQGIDLSGIDRLNQQFGAGFDFREYLAIHAMCHRLIETDEEAHRQWKTTFRRFDAAQTAFRLQLQAEAAGRYAAEAFLNTDPNADSLLVGIPLIKFTTPHHGPLQQLTRAQLLDKRMLIGRLLDSSPPSGRGRHGSGSTARSAGGNSSSPQGSAGGVRFHSSVVLTSMASSFCMGLGGVDAQRPRQAGRALRGLTSTQKPTVRNGWQLSRHARHSRSIDSNPCLAGSAVSASARGVTLLPRTLRPVPQPSAAFSVGTLPFLPWVASASCVPLRWPRRLAAATLPSLRSSLAHGGGMMTAALAAAIAVAAASAASAASTVTGSSSVA